MSKKPALVFSLLSLLLALVAGASVAIRILSAETAGRHAARADFDALSALLSQPKRATDLADPLLRARLTEHYKKSPSLLLVSVYEKGAGVRWRIPAYSPYLPAHENTSPRPIAKYPRASTILFSAPLPSDRAGLLAFDALYVTLPQAAIFQPIRDAALGLCAWLAVVAALLLAAALSGRRSETASWTVSGFSAPGAQPEPVPAEYRSPRESDEATRREAEQESVDADIELFSADSQKEKEDREVLQSYERRDEEDFVVPDIEEAPGDDNSSQLPQFGVEGDQAEAPFGETLSPLADEPMLPKEEAIPPTTEPFFPPDEPEFAADEPIFPKEESTPILSEPSVSRSQTSASAPQGLYSPRSGLGWDSYLRERLDSELSRSASFEQDLSFLIIELDETEKGIEAYALVGKAIVDFFSFRDLSFEKGDFGFAIVLPNIDLDHALRMAEEFLKKIGFVIKERGESKSFAPIYIGVSARAGRLVNAARLEQEAESALEKAREEKDSRIVAFKPDPDKYRLFLASKGC